MTTADNNDNYNFEEDVRRWKRSQRRGRIAGGLIIIGIGILFLAREAGILLPAWLFTWKALFIAAGLYLGIKHAFHGMSWLIMLLVGAVLVTQDMNPALVIRPYVWPAVLIIIGLYVLFRPRRCYRFKRGHWKHWQHRWDATHGKDDIFRSSENYIEVVSIFGNVRKKINARDFKGGEVVAVLGGAEINLSEADIEGKAVLEMVQVFGGTRLIIPPHWQVKSEIVAVLGGIDDKRPASGNYPTDENKVLILQGTAFFGGLEIKSY